MREKRGRYPRRPALGKARLYWQPEAGGAAVATVSVCDVSAKGMRAKSAQAIPVGTMVRVESTELRLTGVAKVRHLTRGKTDWMVGIEFSGGLEWRDPEITPRYT